MKPLVLSALAVALASVSTAVLAQVQPTVVKAARVFDGERMIDDAHLVLHHGRVVALGRAEAVRPPAGAAIVDLGDRVVIPGLIAAHSHVGMVDGVDQGGHNYTREIVAKDLAQFQAFGVVAVNALGLNRPLFHELRTEWRDGRHGGADLYGAGAGVGVRDGAPPSSMNPAPDQAARPTTAQEARDAVDRMADAGVDMIKVWVDDLSGEVLKMEPEVYRAAIDQAHARGLKAAAHIHDLEDAKALIEAGVDVIGHGVRDQPVDQAFIDAMAALRVWYVPTININEAEYLYAERPEVLADPAFGSALNPALSARLNDADWRAEAVSDSDDHRRAATTNIDNLRRLHAAGVRIAMGTDSGATPLRIPGVAEHLEMERMVEAGMSPIAVLSAATRGGAEMMGLDDRGRLTPGARADLLVLDADPEADITATRRIHAVWRNGEPIDR